MSLHMPITKKKIKNHWQYSIWKYALLVVLSILFWNLLFTTTQYRVPEDRKVELYADNVADMGAERSLSELMQTIHTEVMPQMEEVGYVSMGGGDTYGDMQLMVWTSAGQGDVYYLARQRFENLAANGALIDLQPYIDSGALNVEGIDLTRGYVRDGETGQLVLRGIPGDNLPGLLRYGLGSTGMVMGVLAVGDNYDESVAMINYFLENMRQ